MPNGSHEFYEKELLALETFFAQIADVLNEFASKHSLMLDRYYHDSPSWRFNFRHPKGGVASIDVMKQADDSARIYNYWWIDDYDQFTRFLRMEEAATFKLGDPDLARILEEQLRTVLSWQPGEWTWTATDFEQTWGPFPREWIDKDPERYPVPKL